MLITLMGFSFSLDRSIRRRRRRTAASVVSISTAGRENTVRSNRIVTRAVMGPTFYGSDSLLIRFFMDPTFYGSDGSSLSPAQKDPHWSRPHPALVPAPAPLRPGAMPALFN